MSVNFANTLNPDGRYAVQTRSNERQKFQAIAAICADGRPTIEQLAMNGMLPSQYGYNKTATSIAEFMSWN